MRWGTTERVWIMKLENLKLNLETDLVLNVGYPMGATNAPQCYNKLFEV